MNAKVRRSIRIYAFPLRSRGDPTTSMAFPRRSQGVSTTFCYILERSDIVVRTTSGVIVALMGSESDFQCGRVTDLACQFSLGSHNGLIKRPVPLEASCSPSVSVGCL